MLGLNSPCLRLNIPDWPLGGLWNNWPLFLARHELVMFPIYAETLWGVINIAAAANAANAVARATADVMGSPVALKAGQNFRWHD